MLSSLCFVVALLCLTTFCSAAPAPPGKGAVGFEGDPSINVKGILQAAKHSKNVLAAFPSGQGRANNVHIFDDWLNLRGVSAMHFTADMDVDCDGVRFNCPHNPDGQPQTSFGRLDSTKVPWYVLPASFHARHSSRIKPNALGAVICNGKLFYGIFGDTNGASRQVIGEASLLLAQTCFPKDRLDGGKGHDNMDVLYVVFGQDVPKGVGKETIDIAALKKLGDTQVKKLAAAIGVQ